MSTENKFFKILAVRVVDGWDSTEKEPSLPQATIRVEVKKRDGTKVTRHEVAEGNGPVNALNNALRKALDDFFPEILNVHLIGYEVCKRGKDVGTKSKVEVIITSSDGEGKWTAMEVSNDIIRASLVAIAKNLEQVLLDKLKLK